MSAITAPELAERLKSAEPPRLLDVRQPGEFAIAALPEAKLIPLGEIPERITELDGWKNEEIVVYCHHGVRSAHAIGWLRQQGFEKLTNLSGGIDAWSVHVDPELPRY